MKEINFIDSIDINYKILSFLINFFDAGSTYFGKLPLHDLYNEINQDKFSCLIDDFLLNNGGIGVYFYNQLCRPKCYFNGVECERCISYGDTESKNIYLNNILEEISIYGSFLKKSKIKIFSITGGYFLKWSLSEIKQIVANINDNFVFDTNYSFNLEVSLDLFDLKKLEFLLNNGLNTVTLSLHYRGYNEDFISKIIDDIKILGCENIVIDIMYNFSDEDLDLLEKDFVVINNLLNKYKNLKLEINKRVLANHLPCFSYAKKTNLFGFSLINYILEYQKIQETKDLIFSKYEIIFSKYLFENNQETLLNLGIGTGQSSMNGFGYILSNKYLFKKNIDRKYFLFEYNSLNGFILLKKLFLFGINKDEFNELNNILKLDKSSINSIFRDFNIFRINDEKLFDILFLKLLNKKDFLDIFKKYLYYWVSIGGNYEDLKNNINLLFKLYN